MPKRTRPLAADKKHQIRAPDRAQPGLPRTLGGVGRRTRNYNRHVTTTLFVALTNVKGSVLDGCMTRHRHQAFLPFSRTMEKCVPTEPTSM